jgi:hypothetical protein
MRLTCLAGQLKLLGFVPTNLAEGLKYGFEKMASRDAQNTIQLRDRQTYPQGDAKFSYALYPD